MMPRVPRQPVPRDPVSRARFYAERLPGLSRVPWLALLFLAGAGGAFAHFVATSDYFRVKEWRVEGVERLSREETLRLAQLDGDAEPHILRYDADEAKRQLEQNPLVHVAEVRRAYPDRLEVVVRERTEAALLVADSGSFLVDADGVVFCSAGGEELLDEKLPILSLRDGTALQAGAKLPDDARDALFLYAETLARSDSRLSRDLAEVHWDSETGIVLTMRGGARLLCGRMPPAETLPRGEALARKLDGFGAAETADLRIDSHIPWRPVDVPAEKPRRVAAAH